jgi:photosynthetic reaction center H subunit
MPERASLYAGAPADPVGNPMLSGMGPAAYAERSDTPDLTVHGLPRIVPLRADPAFALNPRDPDPRGMRVIGADGGIAGSVVDVWIDRAEPAPRYFEVALGAGGTVLLPSTVARVKSRLGELRVKSILAAQFADVPRTAQPDRITLLEEDRIQAYYAGGYLYATPERSRPLV